MEVKTHSDRQVSLRLAVMSGRLCISFSISGTSGKVVQPNHLLRLTRQACRLSGVYGSGAGRAGDLSRSATYHGLKSRAMGNGTSFHMGSAHGKSGRCWSDEALLRL